MGKLKIESMELGWVATNVYVVSNTESGECLIIDPAAKAEKIIACIEEGGYQPRAILLTHGHADHILAVDELRDRYGIPVYMSEDEKELIADAEHNGAMMLFRKNITTHGDIFFAGRAGAGASRLPFSCAGNAGTYPRLSVLL